MFRITISGDLKLPVCKNYMNFADAVGIYKYQRFGANIFEICPFLLKRSFNGPVNSVKTPNDVQLVV